MLCEHPVSSEPLPAELRAAARPLETQLRLQGIARALTGHPLSSGFVVFFFFFSFVSLKSFHREGGVAVKGEESLGFSCAQLADSAVPAHTCV